MICKYAEIFYWKNVSSFCSAKATHIFSAKNIRILYIESAKTVNEMTLNELVKLTTLWTTGPSYFEGAAGLCIGFTNFWLEHILRGCLRNKISWSHNRQTQSAGSLIEGREWNKTLTFESKQCLLILHLNSIKKNVHSTLIPFCFDKNTVLVLSLEYETSFLPWLSTTVKSCQTEDQKYLG